MSDLILWQRLLRREAVDLVNRFRIAPDTALGVVPIPGAEILCPACSSEARPDEEDTATCGTCGTLSPLDATVAYSNEVHKTLHTGIRARAAMVQGKGGAEVPHVSRGFPSVLVRTGSLLTLAAVSGMRRAQLDELLMAQKPLLNRWVQKELEEGDRDVARRIPTDATGVEIAAAAFEACLPELPTGFPNEDSIHFPLEQAFHAAGQYHKMRTSSIYATFVSHELVAALRERLRLDPLAPVPWEQAAPLVAALDPNGVTTVPDDRYRATEEAISTAFTHHATEQVRLVRGICGRHRVTQTLVA